jgi:hypothetical protein
MVAPPKMRRELLDTALLLSRQSNRLSTALVLAYQQLTYL